MIHKINPIQWLQRMVGISTCNEEQQYCKIQRNEIISQAVAETESLVKKAKALNKELERLEKTRIAS